MCVCYAVIGWLTIPLVLYKEFTATEPDLGRGSDRIDGSGCVALLACVCVCMCEFLFFKLTAT